ncbi:hypothetical protein ACU686_42690 [Yinghuangia aomiensis]
MYTEKRAGHDKAGIGTRRRRTSKRAGIAPEVLFEKRDHGRGYITLNRPHSGQLADRHDDAAHMREIWGEARDDLVDPGGDRHRLRANGTSPPVRTSTSSRTAAA